MIVIGAGEKGQWLRGLAALPWDLGSVPRTYMGTHNPLLTPIRNDLTPSSGFHGYCMHTVHIHAGKNTHTHKTNISILLNDDLYGLIMAV